MDNIAGNNKAASPTDQEVSDFAADLLFRNGLGAAMLMEKMPNACAVSDLYNRAKKTGTDDPNLALFSTFDDDVRGARQHIQLKLMNHFGGSAVLADIYSPDCKK